MQSASSNFTQEASGGQVTWASPRLYADWAADGYGAAGSIDDLSAQVGDSFTITHILDDGLPDDVSLATTQDAVILDVPLIFGRTPGQGVAEGNRLATQYFSPYNASSPVSGFERDTAPVRLDWGLVHAGGQEYVRLFTGQMTNLRLRGQQAEMTAQSATRLKLMKLIQPPAVSARLTPLSQAGADYGGPGMNATWPVSYALAKCGVYVSPPPRSGCRTWIPMHGSLVPFLPDTNDPTTNAPVYGSAHYDPPAGAVTYGTPDFQAGPFLLGTADHVSALQDKRSQIYNVPRAAGADLISKAGNAGRIEFWIKGDAADPASAPGGSPLWLAALDAVTPTGAQVTTGVDLTRKVFVTVKDGAGHNITLQSPTTLATDGSWYFVGAAWDVANKKLWVNHNGTVTTTGAPTFVTTSLPDADSFNGFYPLWNAHMPIAELQITAGVQANPDNYVWINDPSYWTASQAGAIIRPSTIELDALAEPVPREAWEFIGSFAQAELAQTRTDELDRYCYLPMSYWAESAQQAVVDNLSTRLNAQDLDIDLDPSKTRNSVRVTYSAVTIETMITPLYTANSGPPIPPGETLLEVAFERPATDVWPWNFTYLNDLVLDGNAVDNYVSLSTNPLGGDTYATSAEVTASIQSWHAGGCVIRIFNMTPITYYPVNTKNQPSIQIAGSRVNVADAAAVGQEAHSIALRGERALAISLPAIQRGANAQHVAENLAALLSQPQSIVTVSLFGDPRRQPGDLVQLTDAVNTGLSGYWRVQSITHRREGASYWQECILTKARLITYWDQSNWDEGIWGP
jgi:hypothetical protein